MSYLQPFLKSFVKLIPKIEILSSAIQRRNNLLINYPLTLQKTSSNRQTLISEERIKKGNDLILLAMNQCFFSSGFTGSSQAQEMQINDMMQQMSEKYELMNPQFIQKMKIYVQIVANNRQITTGSMPVRDYAEYIVNMPDKGLEKSNINSRYLMALYQNWQIQSKMTFSFLGKELFRRVDEEQFINSCNKGRMVIRSTGKEPFLFAAPFIDKIDHSFDPNCEFQMLYMPHRRSPFVRIRTIRDILSGEKPTINYGKLNNYELLMRYGFSVKENPYSVFMLPLNFQAIIQIFNKNIEWKQSQLLKRNMRLKNYVKILRSGSLSEEDLTMMRILICDSQNPKQERIQSSQYDHLINKYISDHAQSMHKNIKINNLKQSSDRFVNILEKEQIEILNKYLSTQKF